MTDKTYTKQELEEMTNALLAEDNKKKKAEAKAAEQVSRPRRRPRRTTRARKRASWTTRPSRLCPLRR